MGFASSLYILADSIVSRTGRTLRLDFASNSQPIRLHFVRRATLLIRSVDNSVEMLHGRDSTLNRTMLPLACFRSGSVRGPNRPVTVLAITAARTPNHSSQPLRVGGI